MPSNASQLLHELLLPAQTLKKMSFCNSSKFAKVSEWVTELKPAQVDQTSAQLYKALPEVNQLVTNAQTRFDMLEALRPYAQDACQSLSKRFLGQPLSLPEAAQKNAIIAQALQKYLADGYTLCVKDICSARKLSAAQRTLAATALHRAMVSISALFLRSYLIYSMPPKNLWRTIHYLFRVADTLELLDERVTDNTLQEAPVSSVQSAYLRIILLAISRPHQLGQADIQALYRAYNSWGHSVGFALGINPDSNTLFCVDLDSDYGPYYKKRASQAEHLHIEIRLNNLLPLVDKEKSGAEGANTGAAKIPRDIGINVLQHLADCWSSEALRQHDRRDAKIGAEIAIGLRDCHYFLSNGLDFEEFIQSGASHDIQNASSRGFTPREAFEKTPNKSDRPLNAVEIHNTSAEGCCLIWDSASALKVQAGDLIAINEVGARLWSLGVVRWIRQKKQNSQLGVRILSDHAQPYAIAQVYDMGGYSDMMRALFLPQSRTSNTPASIITPSAPFQEQDRVKILNGDELLNAKLDERLLATNNIQQFLFHSIDSEDGTTTKEEAGW